MSSHGGDGEDDDIDLAIEPSGNRHHGLNFSDASAFFTLHRRGKAAFKVYLTRSLEESFKVSKISDDSCKKLVIWLSLSSAAILFL